MRYWGIVALCMLLAACGFKLRGSQSPSLVGYHITVVSQDPYGQLTRGVIARLRQLGAKLVASSNSMSQTFEVILGQPVFGQRTLSVDSNGRPIEYEYSISVLVTIRRDQRDLVQQTFVAHRVLTWDQSRSVARDAEKARTELEMVRELADSIAEMIRIHAPKVL